MTYDQAEKLALAGRAVIIDHCPGAFIQVEFPTGARVKCYLNGYGPRVPLPVKVTQ